MDEHFRRSLGANYQSLFKNKDEANNGHQEDDTKENDRKSPPINAEKAKIEEETKRLNNGEAKDPIKAFQEDMAMATG